MRGHRNRSSYLPPSATRVGARFGRPQLFGRQKELTCSWKGEIEDPNHQHICRIRWGPSSPPSLRSAVDQLDQLPADEERAAGRAGVIWATPRREGLQALAWEGRRSPSLRFSGGPLFPFRAAHSAAHRAKPRPGCGTPLRGLASYAALRREPERRRGARGGVFPCSVRR